MADKKTALLSVLRGNGEFTKNLYQILAKTPGNLFFSPISVHAILSLASLGTSGETKEAFTKALCVPDVKIVGVGYKDVIIYLNSSKDITLSIANKLFLNENYELRDPFNLIATEQFLSQVQLLDFSQSKDASIQINSWVEDKTNGKIKDIIDAQNLTEDTGLVLVNAVYFKGKWQNPFKPKNTRTETFYINESDITDVEMMNIKEKFNYKFDDDLDAKVLELPYINSNFSLIIILPNLRNGIKELEEALALTDLTEITRNMKYVEVIVDLPKFKMEQKIDLKQPLTKIGLGDIFIPGSCDFSGMINTSRPLYVSEVVQKAFIEVNEEGTEAAAATGLRMMPLCMPPPPEEFIADHPFVILLQAKQDNVSNILFSGRIYEPVY